MRTRVAALLSPIRKVDPGHRHISLHAVGTAGLLNRLDLVIASLSPKQALILKLRLSGKSLRDIAKIMGLPEGTVFGENARAVNRLRELLGPEHGDSLTPSLEDE